MNEFTAGSSTGLAPTHRSTLTSVTITIYLSTSFGTSRSSNLIGMGAPSLAGR